jgi:hypothetical protein
MSIAGAEKTNPSDRPFLCGQPERLDVARTRIVWATHAPKGEQGIAVECAERLAE